MLSRIAAIFTVLYISSSIFNFASAQKNDKICEHCRKMATTGSSPYEVLWTLREGIGKEFVPEVLERKMFLRITDIKQAEGIFLEYCRNFCSHTLDGKIWDKTGKSSYKKGKTLHFHSLQEEEKYTKLGRKEFKRLKKKVESASGVKKTTEAKRKPTTARSSTEDNSYAKIYKDLMPNLNFLNRLSSSRSLQPPSAENSTVDPTTLNDTMELSLRQIPDQNTTTPSSDSNTTENSAEDNTTESSLETTGEDTTEETLATTMPTSSESEESTESDEESYEDDSTEEESEESKEPKEESPKKPDKSHEKDDFETLIKYLTDLISDSDSDVIFKRVLPLSKTIVTCVIDITMTEVERALGMTPGTLARERCGASDKQNSLESTIANFLKDILKQSSNLQSAIPLPGAILPPLVIQPQPVFQPELPPNLEFQPNYPNLQPPPQYYNDYDGGIPQQGVSNLIPPPPIIPPPFLTQNNYYEEEPINYPDYSEPEPFIAFPDLTQPPPQPFIPSLGSANAFENFIVWRRTMTDIRNNDEGQERQEFS